MTFYPRVWIALLSLLSLILAPASQPSSTVPPEQRQIGTWLSQLADPDPDVRDAAREALMGLRVAYLDTLKQAISDARPLAPAQASALRDIVRHVSCAWQSYAVDPEQRGFMGVSMGTRRGANPDGEGAIISERYPGFVAYRMLRDGDVIVGFADTGRPVTDSETVMAFVRPLRAGTVIRLNVQRGGRTLIVPLKLDPRPAAANLADNGAALRAEREGFVEQAEEFWETTMAPIVEGSAETAPATSQPASPK